MYKDSVCVNEATYKVNILNRHIIYQLQADKSNFLLCVTDYLINMT